MAIKFYTDEHVHPGIAKALQKSNIDVLTAQRAGMLDVNDDLYLQFATAQGRVMVTQDEDFLKLHSKINHRALRMLIKEPPCVR